MTRPVTTTSYPAKPVGRRWMLWGLFASGTTAATASALSALSLLSPPSASGRSMPQKAWFAETYRGRRITVIGYDVGAPGDHASGMWQVTVDGRPLHLMRRADGSWMTMIDHYQSYPTPLAAARAAVDELGPTAQLEAPGGSGGRGDDSSTPSGRPGSLEDHLHGVHA
ncbi:hypothetical protein M2271_001279 [Streptomyces sp. LBL]|uniref:tyrosinase cofactor n=1 Tax=Streptomyces sp. LBL TaxID=2940562 RepID=UPI002472FF20|nr:tyrosinase cofactor [Streptomyces sp. LBL]MDH6623492.1 hypothetical protein [Streptomyces sp. LBL]